MIQSSSTRTIPIFDVTKSPFLSRVSCEGRVQFIVKKAYCCVLPEVARTTARKSPAALSADEGVVKLTGVALHEES